MNKVKLNKVTEYLNKAKSQLKELLPDYLQDEFDDEVYISGGCIYSLYNDKEPKDYDFFVRSEAYAQKLVDFFVTSYLDLDAAIEFKEGRMKIFYHKGTRVVLTKNAISLGNKQIITKFIGEPREVINEFDFKHNMFWHENDKIETLSQWDFLDSTQLYYNENRARDISGTIIRVHKFCERGMTISNAEMSKMLKKLREVGFTERENEIIDSTSSY